MNGSPPRGEREERRENMFFFWVLSRLRGDVRGEGDGVREAGRNRVGGMRLTSCAPPACITPIECRTSADAVSG